MVILGIDPSLTSTGWCLIKNDKILAGSVSSNPEQSTLKRISHIIEQLWDTHVLVNKFGLPPDYVFVESEAMSGSGQVVQLSELCGAIKHMYNINRCKVLTFTPLQARKIALGTHKIPHDKNNDLKGYVDFIRSYLREDISQYDFGYDDSDRYDACVLAKAGLIELTTVKDSFFDENLMLMRLRDEKILVKNRKGLYTIGSGKKKVQFRNLKKVGDDVIKVMYERYREILGICSGKESYNPIDG